MSLIWHLARTDLRRLRRSLILWAALLATKIALGPVLLALVGRDVDWFKGISTAVYLLGAGEILVGYVLVAWLIHGDLPSGSTAFWMTRPVAGLRLLAAKLLVLLLVFGCLPVAIALPWWLACGYGPGNIALAAGETLAFQGLVVAFALPLATLTNEFSRYLMWTLVAYAVVMFAGLTMVVYPSSESGAANAGLIETRSLIAIAVGLAGGGIAAAHQFWTRRLVHSILLIGGSLLAAFGVLNLWPWDLTGAPPADSPGPVAASTKLVLRSAQMGKPDSDATPLTLAFTLNGVPPDVRLVTRGGEHDWRWTGSGGVARRGWVPGSGWGGPALHLLGVTTEPANAEYEAHLAEMRRRRGLPPLSTPEPGVRTTTVRLPRSLAARMRKDPPFYRLRAQYTVERPAVVGERPLRTGETFSDGQQNARVVGIRQTKAKAVITLTEVQPLLGWNLNRLDAMASVYSQWWQRQYFLINRSRGTAATGYGRIVAAARIGTVGLTWRELHQDAPRIYLGDGNWQAEPGWFDGVTLARVEFREEERFQTELRIDRFQVRGPDAKEAP